VLRVIFNDRQTIEKFAIGTTYTAGGKAGPDFPAVFSHTALLEVKALQFPIQEFAEPAPFAFKIGGMGELRKGRTHQLRLGIPKEAAQSPVHTQDPSVAVDHGDAQGRFLEYRPKTLLAIPKSYLGLLALRNVLSHSERKIELAGRFVNGGYCEPRPDLAAVLAIVAFFDLIVLPFSGGQLRVEIPVQIYVVGMSDVYKT